MGEVCGGSVGAESTSTKGYPCSVLGAIYGCSVFKLPLTFCHMLMPKGLSTFMPSLDGHADAGAEVDAAILGSEGPVHVLVHHSQSHPCTAG